MSTLPAIILGCLAGGTLALLLAAMIAVTFVPRLARRVQLRRFLLPFSFRITREGGIFILGVFLLFKPSPLALGVAVVLFFARLAALWLQLAPRFVEQDFSWTRAFMHLWRPA